MTDPPRLSLQICPYAILRGTAKAFLSFLYEPLGTIRKVDLLGDMKFFLGDMKLAHSRHEIYFVM